MSESISSLLNKAGEFSAEEELLLEQECKFRKLKKGDFLLKKDETCSSLCFIVSGCFYQYSIDNEMDKNVIDLYITDDWVINYKSFASRKPSKSIIQAFNDSSVYELSIDAMHRLVAQSQSFLRMGKILQESTSRIDFFDNDSTPDEKYGYILKNKPLLFQEFPQTIIASYLKITPETLSRVRKRASKV